MRLHLANWCRSATCPVRARGDTGLPWKRANRTGRPVPDRKQASLHSDRSCNRNPLDVPGVLPTTRHAGTVLNLLTPNHQKSSPRGVLTSYDCDTSEQSGSVAFGVWRVVPSCGGPLHLSTARFAAPEKNMNFRNFGLNFRPIWRARHGLSFGLRRPRKRGLTGLGDARHAS